jgi:maltose alpha-D-glucosyltransferase/alpha-amylase
VLCPARMIDDLWYKNAVVYCLDVETFMDSSGDGCGDFEGLTRRLDYLAGLGVTCIWLIPFHPSPNRDNGYDITDYYGVDPRHGSLGDFVDFTHQARQRGLRVIIDLVVNHTSDQHPWFKDARSSKTSKYRDWYVWSKKRPSDWNKGMVFPGVQKSTWTYDEMAGEYYFHRFYDFQPDLNTANPEVRTEILRIMGFWLQLGVSGFRVDALPFVISGKGVGVSHEPDYSFIREMRQFLQWRTGDAVLLAEANVLPDQDVQYFGRNDERTHMMFNFYANQNLFYALASHDVRPLATALKKTKAHPETAQWANFLRNNDELDLGRLEPEQKQEVFAAFAPDPSMQLYDRGIRRRLAPMLSGNRRRLELAYSAMFTMPGTPVIRYGDEIGMGDDLKLRERAAARTPMQWSDEAQGGFTKSETPLSPVIDDPIYGFKRINVAVQRRDPQSFLNWTERIIRMRKECLEIGWGDFSIVPTRNKSVLAIRYDWRGNAVIVLHNFADAPQAVTIDAGENTLVNLLSDDHSRAEEGKHTIALEPYGYRWFRVGGLSYILNRTK